MKIDEIKPIEGAEHGPGGGEIVFENERVRIWDIALEPGGKSAMHTHQLDYILVQVEGEEVTTDPHPDTQGEFDEYLTLPVIPGNINYIERGGTETAVNTGTRRWREICIELKD
jgi:hypothetical protein